VQKKRKREKVVLARGNAMNALINAPTQQHTTTHNNTQHTTTQTHTPLRAHYTRPLREVKDPNLPFRGLVIISAVEIVFDDALFI
jgi:hypothetical protein